jgi:hypothetical protein
MADIVDPRIGADKRTYAEVIATRDKLHEAEQKIGSSFDTHLVTLASGALAVSIGFVEKIATSPQWTIFLFCSWAAFAACILTNLLAILTSQESINRHSVLNKLAYEHGEGNYDNTNRFERRVGHLNWAALSFFIMGVILIVVFSVVNQKGALMANELPHNSPVETSRSAGSLVHISPAPQSQTSGTANTPSTPSPQAQSSTTPSTSTSGTQAAEAKQ